jgi:hypothetical protein
MSSVRKLLLLAICFAALSMAQTIPGRVRVGTKDISGSCPVDGLLVYNISNGKQFTCTSGTWVASSGVPPQTFATYQFSGTPTMSCAIGDIGFQSDATAGQNLWMCTSANHWVQSTGAGTGNTTPILGTASLTVGAVPDGTCLSPGTISVTGAGLGDPVQISTTSALATGVQAIGQVTSANIATVQVCNLSGASVTPGTVSFKATVAKLVTVTNVAMSGAVQGTAGATTLRDIVSVKDYGAKGDGVTDDTAAFQSALSVSGSGRLVKIPAGTYIVSSQLALPDNGYCANLSGAGIDVSTIKLSSTIPGALLYKGSNNNTFGCRIDNLTIDANAKAPYGVQLLIGKAWNVENVKAANATTENWYLGDYLGQGRSTKSITSITRTSNVVTATLASAPSWTSGLTAQIAGVTGDVTLNGYCTGATVSGTTVTCNLVGADTSGSGGTVTGASSGAGFYEFTMTGDYSDYYSSIFTGGSQPNYGFHWYVTATDSREVSGLVSRSARLASFENCGSQVHLSQLHAYGFPFPSFGQQYSYEDCGGANSVTDLESDGPTVAALHLNGSRRLNANNISDQRISPNTALPVAVVESTSNSYHIGDVICSGSTTNSNNLVQLNGASFPDASSSFGTMLGCSGFLTQYAGNAVFPMLLGNHQLISNFSGATSFPQFVISPRSSTAPGVSVQLSNSFTPSTDAYQYGVVGETNARWRVDSSGVTRDSGFVSSGSSTLSANSTASTPSLLFSGSVFTGGTGTTTTPHVLIQPNVATASTSWNTNGTLFGLNSASGFTGDFIKAFINGGGNGFRVDSGSSVYAFDLYNPGSPNNATFAAIGNGPVISRNLADANPSLIVSQPHTGATGDIMRVTSAVTGANSYTFGQSAATFTGGAATGTNNLMTVQDSANNTGTGYVFTAGTASGSTANPFQVTVGGSQKFYVTSSGSVRSPGFFNAQAGASVSGGLSIQPTTTKTAGYTASTGDFSLFCNASGGAFTISLPSAPGTGLLLVFKKIDSSANSCTIAGNGKNIDGATSLTLSVQNQSLMLQYDGTQWWNLTPILPAAVASSETVSFSATPTFSNSTRASIITLTANITSFTLAAGTDGQEKTLTICQNGTGGFTVAPPPNVHGFSQWEALRASAVLSLTPTQQDRPHGCQMVRV